MLEKNETKAVIKTGLKSRTTDQNRDYEVKACRNGRNPNKNGNRKEQMKYQIERRERFLGLLMLWQDPPHCKFAIFFGSLEGHKPNYISTLREYLTPMKSFHNRECNMEEA